MLYRVSGLLTDGRTFASRIEATSAMSAVGTSRKALNEGGFLDESIAEVRCRPIKGKSSVTIGKVRAPKAAKPAATPAPVASKPAAKK